MKTSKNNYKINMINNNFCRNLLRKRLHKTIKIRIIHHNYLDFQNIFKKIIINNNKLTTINNNNILIITIKKILIPLI